MDLNGRFRCSGKAVVRCSFLNAVVCWTLAESLGAFSALREAPRWRLITTEFDGAIRELLRNLAESLLRVSVRFLPPTASAAIVPGSDSGTPPFEGRCSPVGGNHAKIKVDCLAAWAAGRLSSAWSTDRHDPIGRRHRRAGGDHLLYRVRAAGFHDRPARGSAGMVRRRRRWRGSRRDGHRIRWRPGD